MKKSLSLRKLTSSHDTASSRQRGFKINLETNQEMGQTQTSTNIQFTSPRGDSMSSRRYFQLKKQNKQDNIRILRETQVNTIYQNIANHIINKQSVYDIFKTFLDIFQRSVSLKSERYIMNMLQKVSAYNPRVGSLLTMYKHFNITTEQALRIFIMSWLDYQIPNVDVKKYKLDINLVLAFDDMSRKLEEAYFQIEDDKFEQMANKIIIQRNLCREKEAHLTIQMKESKKIFQPQIQKSLALMQRNMNYRVLTTDVLQRLSSEEERIGRFDLLPLMSRRRMQGLDQVLDKLQLYQES
ncbi:hypothetical protein pb186bvf_009958 [Paramecium bursaria]